MLRAVSLVLLAGLAGLAGCGAKIEDTRPGKPVQTRQDAFHEILREFEPMGVMLRTRTYQAEPFARHAERLFELRDRPWPHFGPDTHYPPTKAKAEIWSQAELFERQRLEFIAATEALRAVARDEEAARVAYFKVYDTCKACHDRFKGR